ncbi:MAG: phage tail protein [Firmicutes bacterium]|nr:phage tail protein [Bacillota bacterium]
MANNANYVSTGKPKVGGAVFKAPTGTTLPTDATTALDNAFVCLGYCSADGLTNTNSPETETIYAWGGDPVMTNQTGKPDQFRLKLIEVLNIDVLKTIYGEDNVTGTLANGLTVKANSAEVDPFALVIDMVMRGGVLKRIVIPNAAVAEVGDIVYVDNEPAGYELTINALAGADGDTHKEYLKQA